MEQQKNQCLKKLKVPPLAPGIKESVDKCTKKKRYSIKSDSMKSPTYTILYQTILATIHKSGLYDFIRFAYSQPRKIIDSSTIQVHQCRILYGIPT